MRLFIAVLLSSTIALHAQSASDLEAVIATDMGTVRFEFLPDKAPKHVEQFLKLTKQRYYDDSAFFRILANGVVQGGDPLLKSAKTPRKLWGTGGLNLLPSEYSDVQHVRGIVSTVRIPNKPNSDGSQFFVCLSTQASLDGKFSAFGRVTQGIEILDKISQLPADSSQIAVKPVRITSITLDKKKVEPFLETPVEELNKTVTVTTTLGTL
ncbi:MAG: peptidylprolyl isomerase, partial [Bryobacteraceae bacterium]|nr:peptidylprolyl isomerase [Bryobacteraceae bacterium]